MAREIDDAFRESPIGEGKRSGAPYDIVLLDYYNPYGWT
jgi:hypothetical protein